MMKIIITIPILCFSLVSFSFENLVSGTGITVENKRTLKSSSIPYAIARQGQRVVNNEELVKGFLELESEVYSVSTAPSLIQTKKEGRLLLNNWPLTRWPHAQIPTEISAMLDNATIPGWKQKVEYTSHFKMAGCLNQSPLRFGDVDADAKSELVLFLNGELIIFSPEQGRIVFSTFYEADDWYRQGSLGDENEASDVDGKKYQHHSEMLALNGYEHSAYRSYTKVYVQDFDGDGVSEIVSWRKTYQSYPVGELTGFKLLSNRYEQYKKDESGEYIPQKDTSEASIQGWLTGKSLTWQSGFPSKSECAGQDGQLIPEMHDPLLNDPDVLK